MKKILAFSLAALLALSMTACSGGDESSSSGGSSSSTPSASTASVSAADLAKQMVDATTFNDEMIQISEDVVPNYYNLPMALMTTVSTSAQPGPPWRRSRCSI